MTNKLAVTTPLGGYWPFGHSAAGPLFRQARTCAAPQCCATLARWRASCAPRTSTRCLPSRRAKCAAAVRQAWKATRQQRQLLTPGGHRLPLERFVGEVSRHSSAGYISNAASRPIRPCARRRGDRARHDHPHGRRAADSSSGVEDTGVAPTLPTTSGGGAISWRRSTPAVARGACRARLGACPEAAYPSS